AAHDRDGACIRAPAGSEDADGNDVIAFGKADRHRRHFAGGHAVNRDERARWERGDLEGATGGCRAQHGGDDKCARAHAQRDWTRHAEQLLTEGGAFYTVAVTTGRDDYY